IESLIRGERINLLSCGKREKRQIPLLLTLILFITIVSLAVIYFITPLRVEERRLHAIEAEIAKKKIEAKKVESLKKEVEDLRDEVASINNFKEGRSSLAILKEMTLILPKNTWLTRFRVTETNVDIEGYAGSATELLPKLEASRYFRKAEFSSPTFRDARMNADRFIIKMEIETTKGPEVKIEKK
ncbi:MAG: PilN domain-containing protein, partial [Thermodesulfovibrionales bacterium]